jgi:hypothetical protein
VESAEQANVALRPVLSTHQLQVMESSGETIAWLSPEGLLVILGGEEVRLGLGLRSGLDNTAELVCDLAEVNTMLRWGHIWLCEDQKAGLWSVVWGLNLPYNCLPVLSLQRILFTLLTQERWSWLGIVSKLEHFGGQPYAPLVMGEAEDSIPYLKLWEHLA